MSESKSPNVALSAAAVAPRPPSTRGAPVPVRTDGVITAVMSPKLENLDPSPTPVQATHKGEPSSLPRESRQMAEYAKGAPPNGAPTSDDMFDISAPDPDSPEAVVSPRFAGAVELSDPFADGLAAGGADLERRGALASEESARAILARLGDTEEDLREIGATFAVSASQLAHLSSVSVAEVLELWADLAAYLNSFPIAKDAKATFLTLRSVVALIGAARSLKEAAEPLTGIPVAELTMAFVDRLRMGDAEALAAPRPPKAPKAEGEKRSHHAPKPAGVSANDKPAKAQGPSASALKAADAQAARDRAKREADEKRQLDKALKDLDRRKADVDKLNIAEALKAPLYKDIEKQRAELLKGKKPK